MKSSITANAKINIGLKVLNKRPDGFHNIHTIFAPISFADAITIESHDELVVECSPSLNIPQEKNLAYKAATLLREHFNRQQYGAYIHIQKHIPAGGGLGGGSADAAAVLLALQELWDIQSSPEAISRIALELGSDVPFFLKKGFAEAHCRGELLEYFDFHSDLHILLVLPNVGIPTKWAYEQLRRDESYPFIEQPLTQLLKASEGDFSNLKEHFVNDFEPSVFREYPELAKIKTTLYDFGAVYASMSGSGSTMYGLFDSKEQLLLAQSQFANYKSYACNFNI